MKKRYFPRIQPIDRLSIRQKFWRSRAKSLSFNNKNGNNKKLQLDNLQFPEKHINFPYKTLQNEKVTKKIVILEQMQLSFNKKWDQVIRLTAPLLKFTGGYNPDPISVAGNQILKDSIFITSLYRIICQNKFLSHKIVKQVFQQKYRSYIGQSYKMLKCIEYNQKNCNLKRSPSIKRYSKQKQSQLRETHFCKVFAFKKSKIQTIKRQQSKILQLSQSKILQISARIPASNDKSQSNKKWNIFLIRYLKIQIVLKIKQIKKLKQLNTFRFFQIILVENNHQKLVGVKIEEAYSQSFTLNQKLLIKQQLQQLKKEYIGNNLVLLIM